MLQSARLIEEKQNVAPVRLLEDLDQTRSRLSRGAAGYWARFKPRMWKAKKDKFKWERMASKFFQGEKDLVSLLVASGLKLSMQQYLDHHAQGASLQGSTALDIALHPNDLQGVEYQVVSILLRHGADPNQLLTPGGEDTVFDEYLRTLFLLHHQRNTEVPELRVLEALISHGAYATKPYYDSEHAATGLMTPLELLSEVYGREEATKLSTKMFSNAAAAPKNATSHEVTEQAKTMRARSRMSWRTLFGFSEMK